MKERVVVAMSGGVDSSVVACMLKEDGYDVVGVTLQLYNASGGGKKCCAIDDIYDARRVATSLSIPHYVLNEEELFKKEVIDNFVNSYISGSTPVPCARCNGFVKIKSLTSFAKTIGANLVATGHYAKIILGPQGKEIHASANKKKDQTYFLYSLSQADIDRLMFPIGDMTKDDVRKIARDFDLFVSEKKESQDVCFIPGNYVDFIKKNVGFSGVEGDVLDLETGKKLGTHPGVMHYTIGQRRGVNVSGLEVLYVVKIDIDRNIIWVAPDRYLYGKSFFISEMNIFDLSVIDENNAIEGVQVCTRALKPLVDAKILVCYDKKTATLSGLVELFSGIRAITVGQVCAIYKGARLIGGGVISAIIDTHGS